MDRVLQLKDKQISIADSLQTIEWAAQKLYNTKLFSSVMQTHHLQGDTLYIAFHVTERWYTYAIPNFDIIDRNLNEWWVTRRHSLKRIMAGFDLSQKNLTGNNDLLKLSVLAGYQQKAELSYLLPNYFFNGKIGLTAGLLMHNYRIANYTTANNQLDYLQTRNTSLKRRMAEVGLLYNPDFNHRYWLNAGCAKEWVSDTVLMENPHYFGSATANKLLYGYLSAGAKIDLRNIRGYASRGSMLFVEGKTYLFSHNSAMNFSQIQARWVRHVPFGRKNDLALSTGFKLSSAKMRPYFLNRGMGWDVNAIRNYDYFVMDGSAYFFQKVSFRHRLYNKMVHIKKAPLRQFTQIPFKVVPKVFADVGYVKNRIFPNQGSFLNRPLYAAGVGIDLVFFDDAVWRFEYGINHTGQAAFFLNFTSAIQ